MSLINNVVVNAKSAVDVVGKKAEKVMDVSKLRFAIADIKKEIGSKMESLGYYVYETIKDDDFTGEFDLDTRKNEIDELYSQLIALETQLASVKNKQRCPVCSCINDKEAVYCMKCGSKLND